MHKKLGGNFVLMYFICIIRDCDIDYVWVFFMIQDEKLKKLVEQNGTEDWKVIANFLPVSGYWFLFPRFHF